MKITLLRTYRKQETIRRIDLEELAKMIGGCEAGDEVRRFREIFPLIRIAYHEDGTMQTNVNLPYDLPRLCLSAEFEHKRKARVMNAYNGLVVLEVNNLASYDEAMALRDEVGRLPYTLMAFLGTSGRDVKIVCRGELYPDRRRKPTANDPGTLPTGDEAITHFHYELYNKARKALNAQLGVTVEKLEPLLHRVIYMTADPGLVYHPDALPFYADAPSPLTSEPSPLTSESSPHTSDLSPLTSHLLPGRTIHQTHRLNFLYILNDVLGHYFDLPDEERIADLLMQVASRSLEEGIPMAVAQRMTLQHPVLKIGRASCRERV